MDCKTGRSGDISSSADDDDLEGWHPLDPETWVAVSTMQATTGHEKKDDEVILNLNMTHCKLSNLAGKVLVLVRPRQCFSGAGLIRALFGITDNEYTQLCLIVAAHLHSRGAPASPIK